MRDILLLICCKCSSAVLSETIVLDLNPMLNCGAAEGQPHRYRGSECRS
jgi:hypothetical protein